MNMDLLLSIFGAAATVVCGVWAVGRVIAAQFDKRLEARFASQDRAREEGQKQWNTRMEGLEKRQQELDKDVRQILIELPREYVTRSDYVRRETIIEGKIDQLSLRIQNWILENKNVLR